MNATSCFCTGIDGTGVAVVAFRTGVGADVLQAGPIDICCTDVCSAGLCNLGIRTVEVGVGGLRDFVQDLGGGHFGARLSCGVGDAALRVRRRRRVYLGLAAGRQREAQQPTHHKPAGTDHPNLHDARL